MTDDPWKALRNMPMPPEMGAWPKAQMLATEALAVSAVQILIIRGALDPKEAGAILTGAAVLTLSSGERNSCEAEAAYLKERLVMMAKIVMTLPRPDPDDEASDGGTPPAPA